MGDELEHARSIAVALEQENAHLRAALELIVDKSRRSHDSWRPGREFPTEAAREWHNGHVTALSTCAIVARDALDPEQAKRDTNREFVAACGTDRDWFEATGNCGHCGNPGGDCICTDADPCGCGPHEPRTWPVECWRCDGTGVINPLVGRGVAKEQLRLEVTS